MWSGILPPFTATLYVGSLIDGCLPFLDFSSLPEEPRVLTSRLTPGWSCSTGSTRDLSHAHTVWGLFDYLSHPSSFSWDLSWILLPLDFLLPDFNYIPYFFKSIYTKDLIPPSLLQAIPVLWHQNCSVSEWDLGWTLLIKSPPRFVMCRLGWSMVERALEAKPWFPIPAHPHLVCTLGQVAYHLGACLLAVRLGWCKDWRWSLCVWGKADAQSMVGILLFSAIHLSVQNLKFSTSNTKIIDPHRPTPISTLPDSVLSAPRQSQSCPCRNLVIIFGFFLPFTHHTPRVFQVIVILTCKYFWALLDLAPFGQASPANSPSPLPDRGAEQRNLSHMQICSNPFPT